MCVGYKRIVFFEVKDQIAPFCLFFFPSGHVVLILSSPMIKLVDWHLSLKSSQLVKQKQVVNPNIEWIGLRDVYSIFLPHQPSSWI